MKNVFLIDDDLSHIAVLAVALIDAGYQIIAKIDSESAVAVLGENIRIDLIIINYEMQGLDAFSFMTMLRELMPNVPVIVLTVNCNVDNYLKVMSLGAIEYMSKPVRIAELRRVIEAALLDSERDGLSRISRY